MGKLAYFMETLFQGHFVHHKYHWWNTDRGKPKYRQVLCYAKDLFLKSVTNHTEFLYKTVYFLGVMGLTTSSCIVYDYTTSGLFIS
jgi:hypothetical protein